MCSVDGADPAQCDLAVHVDASAPGEHKFEVYATHPTFLDRFGEPVEPHYEPVVVDLRVDRRRHDAARHGDHVRPARDDR